MRKLLLLLFTFAIGCSKISVEEGVPPIIPEEKPSYTLQGYKVTSDVASEIALDVYKSFVTETKSGLSVLNNTPVTYIGAGETDTLMYLINYDNDQGYAMISSDIRSGEIIAFVDKGSFNIGDTATNSLQRLLVEMMINYQRERFSVLDSIDNIIYAETKGVVGPSGEPSGPKSTFARNGQDVGPICTRIYPTIPRDYAFGASKPIPNRAYDLGFDIYYPKYGCVMPIIEYLPAYNNSAGPLLTTQWHQYGPFNDNAPMKSGGRAVAGCVATAVAQIMAYHSYPKYLPGTNYSGAYLYMDDIRTLPTSESFEGKDPAIKLAVARLFRALGDMLDNSWSVDGTGAADRKVIPCFATMNYPTSHLVLEDYDYTTVIASLNEQKPVYISAYEDWWHTKGHAWVIDGYKILKRTARHWNYRFDENGNYNGRTLLMDQELVSTDMMHCNFGWGSLNQNTWYASGIFNPTTTDGISNYKYQIDIIANIKKP